MNQTTQGNLTAVISTGFSSATLAAISICALGTFTNIINVLVFINPKLKDLIYKYMLVKSLSNLAYLALSFANQFLNACVLCSWTVTYWANVYYFVSGLYIQSCLIVFRVLIEIVISIHIYSILINRVWLNKVSYKLICIILLIVSLVYYAQKPFACLITLIPNTTFYYVAYSQFGLTRTNYVINIVQGVVRVFLTVVVLTILNAINVNKFRQRVKIQNVNVNVSLNQPSQSSLTKQSNKNLAPNDDHKTRGYKNVTKMVVVSTFFKAFFETPVSIAVMVIFSGFSSPAFNDFYLCSVVFVYVSPSVDVVIYYLFNTHYRSILNGYFRLQF
jgi:hypothetical protein